MQSVREVSYKKGPALAENTWTSVSQNNVSKFPPVSLKKKKSYKLHWVPNLRSHCFPPVPLNVREHLKPLSLDPTPFLHQGKPGGHAGGARALSFPGHSWARTGGPPASRKQGASLL